VICYAQKSAFIKSVVVLVGNSTCQQWKSVFDKHKISYCLKMLAAIKHSTSGISATVVRVMHGVDSCQDVDCHLYYMQVLQIAIPRQTDVSTSAIQQSHTLALCARRGPHSLLMHTTTIKMTSFLMVV